jgi:hypothetical protein
MNQRKTEGEGGEAVAAMATKKMQRFNLEYRNRQLTLSIILILEISLMLQETQKN